MPAAIAGLVTASSMSTLPIMLQGCKNNIIKDNDTVQNKKNIKILNIILPICLNMHTIGYSVVLIFLTFFVNKIYGGPNVTLWGLIFLGVSVTVTKFGSAGVPGGGLIVLIPILEEQLHFNQDMVLLMITLDILCDYFVTFCNLMGNGFFIEIFNKIYSRLLRIFHFSENTN